MKFLILILVGLWGEASLASPVMDKIRTIHPIHPDFPDLIIELQSEMLQQKRWENVLGIGLVFRKNFAQNKESFRVAPFLMEAYSLIQFCRHDDAQALINLAEFYVIKYELTDDLVKIQKAKELEGLSKFYKNLKDIKVQDISFVKNELQWPVASNHQKIFMVLDKIMIKPESLCQF